MSFYACITQCAVTVGEPTELRSKLANWMTLHEYLCEDDMNRETILNLLFLEVMGRCRMDIVNRLFNKYSTYRKEEDRIDMLKFMKEVIDGRTRKSS